jgi:DNA-directed RNA polymerase alpha subunit
MKSSLRICKNGHRYYKSSDCPTCPVCEQERKPDSGFLSSLSAPARRALEGAGIKSLQQLTQYSEADLLQLHGMGSSTIPKLKKALKAKRLSFKNVKNRQKRNHQPGNISIQ